MAFVGRMKELDELCQVCRSWVLLGSPRVSLPGTSGVSCPCFHLELELPGPDKSGPPYVYGHCSLLGSLLVILLVELPLFSAFCNSFSFWTAIFSLSNMLDSLLFFQ